MIRLKTNSLQLIVILTFLIAGSSAFALDQLFLGPTMGATSTSSANGAQNRDSLFSFGAEEFQIWNHWSIGASYKYIASPTDGNQTINVSQATQWLSAEEKFRIWNENFSPYVSAGLGGVLESVSTQVMGPVDHQNGIFFSRDFGIGMAGRITNSIGINLSARYFQYSNINGFDYSLSLGWFPSFIN